MRHNVDNVNHTDADVLDLLQAVMHECRSLQHQALRDGEHGVTPMDARVLGFFARRPGATQSDLTQHSGRNKAQVARLVAGLRERGLLQAEADAGDRRSLRLSLTEQGAAVQRSLKQHARRISQRATAGLTPSERACLLELLARLKANLASR